MYIEGDYVAIDTESTEWKECLAAIIEASKPEPI
jgi:hypothetical protein